MSALSILYLVLPFPLAFLLHDMEEMIVQHKWMTTHATSLFHRFPRLRSLLKHLLLMDTKSFAIAVAEEFIVIAGITAYVCMQGPYALFLWTALFMAFSLHLLIHFIQAILIRGYIPGLVSCFLLLPYVVYGVWSISLVLNVRTLLLLSIVGLLVVMAHLWFSHWLGLRLTGKK